MDVLNAATPVLIAILGFATVIWALERRTNKPFEHHDNAVYFAFVSTSTFGYGDMAPTTTPGRLLLVFWTVFTSLSLTAFGGIVSSALTVGSLSIDTIDSLQGLSPNQVCVDAPYDLVNQFVAETLKLPLDQFQQVGGGVLLGDMDQCLTAVQNGTALVYVSDAPLLNWIANQYVNDGTLYVSPILRRNPLTWAFPSGSPIRDLLDSAVISMVVNGTWVQSVEAMEATWFPTGAPSPASAPSTVTWPTLIAALVLIGGWLLGVTVRSSIDTYKRFKEPPAEAAAQDDAVPVSTTAAAAVAARDAARAAEAAADAAEAAAAAEAEALAAAAAKQKSAAKARPGKGAAPGAWQGLPPRSQLPQMEL